MEEDIELDIFGILIAFGGGLLAIFLGYWIYVVSNYSTFSSVHQFWLVIASILIVGGGLLAIALGFFLVILLIYDLFFKKPKIVDYIGEWD